MAVYLIIKIKNITGDEAIYRCWYIEVRCYRGLYETMLYSFSAFATVIHWFSLCPLVIQPLVLEQMFKHFIYRLAVEIIIFVFV